MVTFNILGCCVSREPINTLQTMRQDIEVNQYVAFIHPISLCSPKGERHISMDDLNDYKISNFRKRNFILDVNKTAFDYLFAKKSDYIIIDVLDARHTMIKKNNSYITLDYSTMRRSEKENQRFKWMDYVNIDPFSDIDDQEYKVAIDYISKEILKHYKLEQIILIENYAIPKSIDFNTGRISDFPINHFINSIRFNKLFKKLFSFFKSNLKNCHIIEFPNTNTVLTDINHPLGKSMFHFWQPLYDYVAKSLNVILNHLPSDLEIDVLSSLKQQYELSANNIILQRYLNSEFTDLHTAINTASQITTINNFEEYLNILKHIFSKYLVVLTIKDTPGDNLSDSIITKIKGLGFSSFTKQRRRMYIGVAYKSLILSNQSANQPDVPIEYTNEQLSLKATSNTYTQGNSTQIIINGTDYAVNQRGINIVIYDTERNQLIDSIAFDQHFSATNKYKNKGFTRE